MFKQQIYWTLGSIFVSMCRITISTEDNSDIPTNSKHKSYDPSAVASRIKFELEHKFIYVWILIVQQLKKLGQKSYDLCVIA